MQHKSGTASIWRDNVFLTLLGMFGAYGWVWSNFFHSSTIGAWCSSRSGSQSFGWMAYRPLSGLVKQVAFETRVHPLRTFCVITHGADDSQRPLASLTTLFIRKQEISLIDSADRW